MDKVVVRFFKGPYATEPLTSVIEAAAATIELLRDVSPTAAQVCYEQVVRAAVPADSPDLSDALAEVENNTGDVLAASSFKADQMAAAAAGGAVPGDPAGGTSQVDADAQAALADAQTAETTLKNDLGAQKRDYISNSA